MSDVEIPNGEEVDPSERGIGVAISVLAVLLAVTAALGGKADNDEIIGRVDESNTWAQYQAKKVRSTSLNVGSDVVDVIATLQGRSPESEQKTRELQARYKADSERYEGEMKEIKAKAEGMREDADRAARQGDMYDMAEFLFQVGLVLSSVTLLLKSKAYFRAGLGASLAASGFLAYAYFFM